MNRIVRAAKLTALFLGSFCTPSIAATPVSIVSSQFSSNGLYTISWPDGTKIVNPNTAIEFEDGFSYQTSQSYYRFRKDVSVTQNSETIKKTILTYSEEYIGSDGSTASCTDVNLCVILTFSTNDKRPNELLLDVEVTGWGAGSYAIRRIDPLVFNFDLNTNQFPLARLRSLYVPPTNDVYPNPHFDASGNEYKVYPGNSKIKFTSYEATAIIDSSTRKGLVIGSTSHDQWKTGIASIPSVTSLNTPALSLRVINGMTFPQERGYQEWAMELKSGSGTSARYWLKNRGNGNCISALDNSYDVALGTCQIIPSMLWRQEIRGTSFALINDTTGRALDIPGGLAPTPPARSGVINPIIQFTANYNNNQLWQAEPSIEVTQGDYVKLKNNATGTYLSISTYYSGQFTRTVGTQKVVQHFAKGVHGKFTGSRIKSSQVFLGSFADWRAGMEAFAEANRRIAPALSYRVGVPFGWNSFAAFQGTATSLEMNDASRLLDSLRKLGFSNPAAPTQFVNWDGEISSNISALSSTSTAITQRGQKGGLYIAPMFTNTFGCSEDGLNNVIPGYSPQTTFREVLLRDDQGEPVYSDAWGMEPQLWGPQACVLDVTHPAVWQLARNNIDQLLLAGYDYVKIDFMTPAIFEGKFFDPTIRSGTQAYNSFMRKIRDYILDPMRRPGALISLSLAPLFPYQYTHARRMERDTYGDIEHSEYAGKALSYGWWVDNSLFRFNDPDHFVLYRSRRTNDPTLSEDEARTRYVLSAISGSVMLNSDNLTDAEVWKRALRYMTSAAVNRIAASDKAFRPVEATPDIGKKVVQYTANINGTTYLAIVNFSDASTQDAVVNLARLGLSSTTPYSLTDLWDGNGTLCQASCTFHVAPKQSMLLRVDDYANGTVPIKVSNRGTSKTLTATGGSSGRDAVLQWDEWSKKQSWSVAQVAAGYHRVKSFANDELLDVQLASTADGAKVITYPTPATGIPNANQLWSLGHLGSGFFKFTNKNSLKVLDAPGSYDGVNAVQWTSNGGLNQSWKLIYANLIDADISSTYTAQKSYSIVNASTGMAMDLDSRIDGSQVFQKAKTFDEFERWRFESAGAGHFRIYHSAPSGGKLYLDLASANSTDGMSIVIRARSNSDSQLWQLVDLGDGYSKILNKFSGKALDVPNGTMGYIQIVQFTGNTGKNQKWRIAPNP